MWMAGIILTIFLVVFIFLFALRQISQKKRDILDVSEQDCAVILSVICEELRARPEELRITVIRKLAQEE